MEAFADAGVTEETQLELDFFYMSGGSDADEELDDYLTGRTDYDVQACASRQYGVTGSTQPTKVSVQVLDEWVAWMVRAGYEHGRCKFDGWGAAVP